MTKNHAGNYKCPSNLGQFWVMIFFVLIVLFIHFSPLMAYPKTLAHKRVDDRIGEAVGHRQPMADDVRIDEKVELLFRAIGNEFVLEEVLVQLHRKPTNVVQNDDDQHHFDDLRREGGKGKMKER